MYGHPHFCPSYYKWFISLTLVERAKLLENQQPHPQMQGMGYSLEKLQAALDEAKQLHTP
ncbi:hypothetical protein ACIDI_113c00170 [Acidiphilium sp. JA12-A1]|nr:hypothetical protein ACIDI_113c00170 [Acidiphilium sp. JA12-A1]